MGFDYSKIKHEPASKRVCRIARSSVPLCKVYDKRVAADGNGYWGMVFYYYFLEKLIKKLQNELDHTKEFWETEAWKKAAEMVDEEPDDVVEGLRNLEALYSNNYPAEIYNLRDVIRILTAIKDLRKNRT